MSAPITDPVELAKRRAAYAVQVREMVDRNGWMVQGVFPTDDDGVHFGYTVGFTAFGLPELCMTGVPPQVYQAVLNWLGQKVYDGRRFSHGETVEAADDGGPDGYLFMLVVGPASPETVWPGTARMLYGADNVRLQQIVWQSEGHRWPWDENYDGPEQPTIGRPS